MMSKMVALSWPVFLCLILLLLSIEAAWVIYDIRLENLRKIYACTSPVRFRKPISHHLTVLWVHVNDRTSGTIFGILHISVKHDEIVLQTIEWSCHQQQIVTSVASSSKKWKQSHMPEITHAVANRVLLTATVSQK